MNEEVLGEIARAWNRHKPNDPAYGELIRVLRGFETDHAAVLDADAGPWVGAFEGQRLLLLSTQEAGVTVESRHLPEDLVIRREPTGREPHQTQGGNGSLWRFTSPSDGELGISITGWVSDNQEGDRAELFALAIATEFGWPA